MNDAKWWQNEQTCFVFNREDELKWIRRIQADALRWALENTYDVHNIRDRLKELEQ